jgi:hypothetical protein
LLTFFTSRGFARDIDYVGRACAYAGTALLFISLLGISTPAINAEVAARIASLWSLEVKSQRNNARASWEAALTESKPAAQEQVDPPDSADIRLLTRSFVRSYLASPIWQTNADARRREAEVRGAVAREHVIEQHLRSAGGTAFEKVGGLSTVAPNDPVIRSAQRSIVEPQEPGQLELLLEKRLRDDLSTHKSGLWKTIKGKVTAFRTAYGEPAQAGDFAKVVLGQILDPAFNAAKIELDNEYLKQVQNIVSKGFKSAAERSINTMFERFLADLAGASSMKDAITAVANAPTKSVGLTPAEQTHAREFLQQISSRTKGLADALSSKHVAMIRVEPVEPSTVEEVRKLTLERLTKPAPGGETRTAEGVRELNYLVNYEDYFAADRMAAEKTLRSKLLADARIPLTSTELTAAVERSRSFVQLNTFKRVGGVLIGRDPMPSTVPPLEISSLQWTSDRSSIGISVADKSGREVQLGSFPADLIYRSLLFAADGRPLVVTIINTDLLAQKVVMHPALADTRTGCMMIELDRFIFHYLDKEFLEVQQQEITRVERYNNLYMLAVHFGERDVVSPEYRKNLESMLQEIVANAGKEIEEVLSDPFLFSDKERSPLAAEDPMYAKPVLDAMRGCVATSDQKLETFGACMAEEGAKRIKTKRQFENWTRALRPQSFVSGVRDRTFYADSAWTFLQQGEIAKPDTWPLQFLIQDTDNGRGGTVWAFPFLQPEINKGTAQLIASNTDAHTTFVYANNFAILQRLFRMALDGRLGPEFPASQLVALAEDAKTRAKDSLTTERWFPSAAPQDDVLKRLSVLLDVPTTLQSGQARPRTCQLK